MYSVVVVSTRAHFELPSIRNLYAPCTALHSERCAVSFNSNLYAGLCYAFIYNYICSHLAILTLSSHHCPCKDGMNALCLAICGNHPDVVKLLVDEFNMSLKVKSPVSN